MDAGSQSTSDAAEERSYLSCPDVAACFSSIMYEENNQLCLVLPPLPTTALPSELQPPNMNDYPDFKEDLLCVADQLDLPVFQENAHWLHAQNLLKDLSEKL